MKEMFEIVKENAKSLADSLSKMDVTLTRVLEDSTTVNVVLNEFSTALQGMLDNISNISETMNSMEEAFVGMKEEAKDGADYAKQSNEEAFSIMTMSEQARKDIEEKLELNVPVEQELSEGVKEALELMKEKTFGAYDKLVEVGRKYQADSKIMFDKMQDFYYLSEEFSGDVSVVTASAEKMKNSANQSINALFIMEEGINMLSDDVRSVQEERVKIQEMLYQEGDS